jgi:hypothetical protein
MPAIRTVAALKLVSRLQAETVREEAAAAS